MKEVPCHRQEVGGCFLELKDQSQQDFGEVSEWDFFPLDFVDDGDWSSWHCQEGRMNYTVQHTTDFSVLLVEALHSPQTWISARLVVFQSCLVVCVLVRLDWIQEVGSVEVRWDCLVLDLRLPFYVATLLEFLADTSIR